MPSCFRVAPKIQAVKEAVSPHQLTLEHFYSSFLFWGFSATVALCVAVWELAKGRGRPPV